MLKNSHVKIASPKPVNIRGLNLQYFSRQKIIMLSIYFVPLNPVPAWFQFQPAVVGSVPITIAAIRTAAS